MIGVHAGVKGEVDLLSVQKMELEMKFGKHCLYSVADVTVRNLNQIMTYLIVAIKELIFVWCVKP